MIDEQRSKQTLLFVDSLSNDELNLVHRQAGDEMRLINRAHELHALQAFYILNRVFFHHNYEHIEGNVVRINQRTVSIVTDSGVKWTVTPQHLTKRTSCSTKIAKIEDYEAKIGFIIQKNTL